MNFLALIQKPFKTEAPRVNATLVACPSYENEPTEYQQRPLARSTAYIATDERLSAPQTAPKRRIWNEPKRIQRLRELAELSSFGYRQIEGEKIGGDTAKIAIKMYDQLTEQAQYQFVATPMRQILECVAESHALDLA